MEDQDKVQVQEGSSDLEGAKKADKPKQGQKAKPEPKPAVEADTPEEVVGLRTLKLQVGVDEGIEMHPGLRTFVTVTLGSAAIVGEQKVGLGETVELTEDTTAKCSSFSQIEIKWVK